MKLEVLGALATGSAGMSVAVKTYSKLSKQFADYAKTIYKSVQDLQDQVLSLAGVVLQNRKGLDLLTTDKGSICLTLQEKWCFYAKKWNQKNTKRNSRNTTETVWSTHLEGRESILPYIIPLLGPLLGLSIFLLLGPFLFNKLMAFIKSQMDAIKMQPIQLHYCCLDMAEMGDNCDEF